ncbi:MAG: hypothetical protein PHE24_04770 [Patescibacteria group bacterium]|nr:hypothetical protein [Patescibacteria group bacterium]
MVSQEDIIKSLFFLDIFDYPPTAMEIWRFLPVKAELGELMEKFPSREGWTAAAAGRGVLSMNVRNDVGAQSAVTHPASQGSAPLSRGDAHPVRPGRTPLQGGEYSGFYFLPGREELIEKRREFFYLSEKKFKIAKRAAWLLHFIPSVKMVAVCNNFYYRPESDIDFFIITSPKRLWLTRFFATLILDLFHRRARGKKTADRVCLSFYLSEDNLNLENIALKPAKYCGPTDMADPYFYYWLGFLEPIYGEDCYNKFWQANSWLKNIFPNILPKQPVLRWRINSDNDLTIITHPVASGTRHPSREGTDWLEKIAKKIQWWKISPLVKKMAALGDTRVVINDRMLKFHENDRREFFREELRKPARGCGTRPGKREEINLILKS